MFFSISTAGIYDPLTVGWEQWEYAQKVLNGSMKDTSFFALVYGISDEEMKNDPLCWQNPEMWEKANPSLGKFLRLDFLAERETEAENSPTQLNAFLRYHLNVWVQHAASWLDIKLWMACKGDYTDEDLLGRECYGGMDLSLNDDITAVILYFPSKEEGEKDRLLCRFYLPKENIAELEKVNNAPYQQWADEGLLTLTPGDIVDTRLIEDDIKELKTLYDLREIAFDTRMSREIVSNLMEVYSDEFMIQHQQGPAAMNGPITEAEIRIKSKQIEHSGNDILTWHIGNCQTQSDRNGSVFLIKSDRKGQVRYKIDGAVAMMMALSRAIVNKTPEIRYSVMS
jgi:phage terminase large subunit-like protein